MIDLHESVALVTGGAHRLGRAIALALGQAGANVVVHYNRSAEQAQAVLHEDQEVSREEVLAAVGSMRRTEDQNRRAQLKGRIKEAERSGKFEEALRLATELQLLEQAARARK